MKEMKQLKEKTMDMVRNYRVAIDYYKRNKKPQWARKLKKALVERIEFASELGIITPEEFGQIKAKI